MPSILKDDLYGLLRHLLSGVGLSLVTHGVLTAGQADSLDALLAQTLTGLICFGGAVAWSWVQKHRSAQVKLTALALAGVTEHAVEKTIASGVVPTVLTSPSIVPVLVPIPLSK